jgi:hypothetical protein
MSGLHAAVGYALLVIYTVGWVWAVVTIFLPGRDPGRGFWVWLTVQQTAAGVQAVIGIVLLLAGRRPTTWLHFVYGFGPIAIFLVAHGLARELKRSGSTPSIPPWAVFGAASFICFGLSMRALMTGLGTG